MFEKITKTLSGLAFIKYINSLIDYVNTSDIDATRIKGQLDISNIPPAGLDNVIKVDTVTDMLALTVDDVQNGDTVMIIGVTPPVQYQVVDDTKLGTMDAFQEYAAGTATKALADINGNNIHTTYGKLAGNNTWTGNNYWNGSAIFNANLNIRGSATTPGDTSVYLWLGLKPEGSEQAPCIARNKTGELIMYAADYRHCFLKSGIQTSFASVYNSDGTVEFSSLNNTPWGKYTNANGLELTVNKTPTVNTDVSNKKYVDDSIAEGTVYRSKSTITHPLQITKGNTIGQLKEAIVTLANKIKLLSQVTGCIGYFTCAETWADNWTNDDFVLEEGQMWSVEIVSINSYNEGYWVARITSYSEKSCYIVSYTNLIWSNLHKYAFLTDVTSAVANLLSSNNTWTGSNVYNKNITVSNGTASGSEGTIDLGKPPTSKTKQPNIYSPGNGNLIINASENSIIALQSGDVIQWSVKSDEANTKTSAYLHSNLAATYTPATGVVWEGNANTATKLQTARTINGVAFDGTQDITINCDAGSGSNLTTYTSLEQIGITPGEETFTSIHSALPINSVLEYYASEAQNFADIYPASYGNFIATRLTEDITIFHFTGTNQIIYVTHYHVTANTNPSWTQIAKQSDLTNLSNSVVKSVNGIKPTNGNVTIDIPKPVIASEAEAEAGTNNTKFMSPLRVKQAISALAGDSSWTISKGTNGWARENSTGLTVQWGYLNRSNISGTFTFPRTFTTCYYSNVMCSSNLVPYIIARSNTSITFNTNNGYNDDIQNWGNCYIFAIGVS